MRKRLLVVTLATALAVAASPAWAQQPTSDTEAWRALAQALEPGSFVSVRTKDGTHLRGTLVQPSPEGILLKPKTRLPVPIREIRFDDIDSIERQKQGMSPGAKVAIGVGTGVGVLAIVGALVAALAY